LKELFHILDICLDVVVVVVGLIGRKEEQKEAALVD